MSLQPDYIPLGKTGIQVSPLGLGAWSWGDRFIWSYGRTHTHEDIRAAYEINLKAGVNFFDTAEIYGSGHSERILGELLSEEKSRVVVATKFAPFPWRWEKKSLSRALHNSLKRLRLEQVDLYQIHWPLPPISVEAWADALADAFAQGLTKSVGVSNYSEAQMRRAYTVLAKRGIPLASNQVEYSLLKRDVELNGLLKACKELGISLISYSPLAMGALTGKYTPEHLMPGMRSRMYPRSLIARIQPMIRKMRDIGRGYGDKSPAQVALNWCMAKGTIPIPGSKNAEQATENIGAMGWNLSEADVIQLDEIAIT
jgi:aryl-alcohol dehydrogenase-like predicted oxidoreductase